jgi:hypothetical protein
LFTLTQILPILILGALAWFWWDSGRAREIAVRAAKQACQRCGVQFLDQTVALRSLRVRRDNAGQLRLFRKYTFEFSHSGAERDGGYAVMVGQRLADMHLDLVLDAVPQTQTRH